MHFLKTNRSPQQIESNNFLENMLTERKLIETYQKLRYQHFLTAQKDNYISEVLFRSRTI